MKKMYYVLGLVAIATGSLIAQPTQVVISTGATYSKNIWYQLETGTQYEASATNWDLALSTSISQTNPLTTTIRFNHKIGAIFEFPIQVPLDFENADTIGFHSWTPLYNVDSSWFVGALNASIPTGAFDYGWGTYDMGTHSGIQANRIFLIKYNDGTFKKLKIDLSFPTQSYTITHANLDNTSLEVSNVSIAGLSGKNFIYFSTSGGVQDREPLSNDWDLTFMQYPSFDFSTPYLVTGILQNVGVLASKVYPVANTQTFVDFTAQPFSENIDIIGYDWKSFQGAWNIEDPTAYFVQDKSGSIWKIITTNFGGSATGEYSFTKEKMTNASIDEKNNTSLILYPNPTENLINVIVSNINEKIEVAIYNSLGQEVHKEQTLVEGFGSQAIDVSSFPNGTYTLQIKALKEVYSKRFQVVK
jgi:hypothetical protein